MPEGSGLGGEYDEVGTVRTTEPATAAAAAAGTAAARETSTIRPCRAPLPESAR